MSPPYRQVLASVRSLLDLPMPEEYAEGPSKIFEGAAVAEW